MLVCITNMLAGEGVERMCVCVCVLQDEFKVTERTLVMKELLNALKGGRVLEVFGAGTACVVCPVGSLYYKGQVRPRGFINRRCV